MKSVFVLMLSILAFIQLASSADTVPTTTTNSSGSTDDTAETVLKLPVACNQFLLGTFKLDMSPVPENTPNLVCPGITSNCCSYAAQHQINRLWAKGSERTTVVNIYRGFIDTYKSIFTQFSRIELMAQTIIEATDDQMNNPCNMLAKSVVAANFSSLQDVIIKAANNAFDFLYSSRKGFYCSLCDKNAHNFYQTDGELIAMSYSFCSNMVAETLPYFLFKHLHFMKMSRLYGELMAKCSIDGDFSQNEYLNNVAIFIKDEQYIDELTSCKDNLLKTDAYVGCEDFCERFNPTRFDTLLEGDLSKLAGFSKLLKALADSKSGIVVVSNKDALINITENSKRILSEISSNKQGRRLAETPSSGATGTTNTSTAPTTGTSSATSASSNTNTANTSSATASAADSADRRLKSKIEVNNFNDKYETALIRPVTYNFLYDLSALFKINFDYSYIQSSHNTRYNISDWRTEIMKDGINFYYYGRSADMTKATAYKVFLQANSDTSASGAAVTDSTNASNTPTISTDNGVNNTSKTSTEPTNP